MKKKNPYKGIAIAGIIIIVIIIAIVLILGFTGLVNVPGMTQSVSITGCSDTNELSRSDVQRMIETSDETPTLSELESYGLIIHGYGTDDRPVTIKNCYAAQLVDWNKEYSDSGSGWEFTIWRNIAYGFGLVTYEGIQVHSIFGYDTVFATIEGPASAWLPLLGKI